MNRQGILVIGLIAALGCGGGGEGRREVSVPAADRGVTRKVPALCPTSHLGEPTEEPPKVDQSAGLFVGAASFLDRSIGDVDFACDDAVDLAYRLSNRLDLLSPGAVALLLSGTPAKDESKAHLEWLRKAGAQVEVAERSRVESLTREMAKRVGPRGMLVMAFATHGYAIGGKHYLLLRDSSRRDPEMNVSVEGLMRLSPLLECARRLVFLDVCRQQREWPVDSPGTLEAITGRYGVLSAASPGGASFADYERRNGIFTGALLGGLRCPAQPDPDGFLKLHRVWSCPGFVDTDPLGRIGGKGAHDGKESAAVRAGVSAPDGRARSRGPGAGATGQGVRADRPGDP